jgi:type I restriction enzyme S subunit
MGREMATSQDFVNWVCGPRLLPDYLKYILLAERDSLLRFASGTTHQTIYYPEAKAFHALLPPPREQGQIAEILRALDDKIELNRRLNETLEEMARALFKSWFVDFDPVHAKAAGKKPFGMDEATADHFPTSFRGSELGSIPNSWQLSSVREQCEAVYDGPHATPARSPVGPLFLGIRNLKPLGLDLAETRRLSEEDWPRWTKRVVPAGGDIVFSYEATLGYFAILPQGLRCCLGRRLALVRPLRSPNNGHYLFHYFVSAPFQAYLKQHASVGATVDRILIADFPQYPVLQPKRQLVTAFEDRASAWWATIHSRSAESYTLATLREALLPKLLSGELRITDAEKLIGEAT